MERIIQLISDQVNALNASLVVFDASDRLLFANDIHRSIYEFMDYSKQFTYNEWAWGCIRHKKLSDKQFYNDPKRWMDCAENFRLFNRYSKSLTCHSDGRVFEVIYQRLDDRESCWYQMRREVTVHVRDGMKMKAEAAMPHVLGAPSLQRCDSSLTVGLLDTLPHPGALITPEAQVIDTNRAFDELVAVGDGVVMVGGRLRFPVVPEEDRRFLRRAAEVSRAAGRSAGGEPVTLRLPRTDQTSPYFASLSVPPSGGSGAATPIPGVLLFSVIDPDTLPPVAPGIVANLLQITAAEAKVAMALAAGRTVDEIAGDRGVGRRTVYNQVTSILNKTGLRNQAGIVRQVTALSFALSPRLRPSR